MHGKVLRLLLREDEPAWQVSGAAFGIYVKVRHQTAGGRILRQGRTVSHLAYKHSKSLVYMLLHVRTAFKMHVPPLHHQP